MYVLFTAHVLRVISWALSLHRAYLQYMPQTTGAKGLFSCFLCVLARVNLHNSLTCMYSKYSKGFLHL